MLSEIIGPAAPSHSPTQDVDVDENSTPCVAKVELARKRVLKDGRVKLKLSLLGVSVDKCGICLSQFKEGVSAALSPACRHIFHETCLKTWMRTSRTCPTCRVKLAGF